MNVSLTMVTYAPNSKRTFSFYGMEGNLEASWEMGIAKIRVTKNGIGIKKNKKPCETIEYTFNKIGCHGGGDEIIMTNLVDAITNNKNMAPSIEDAFVSNITCIAITESLKSKKVEIIKII